MAKSSRIIVRVLEVVVHYELVKSSVWIQYDASGGIKLLTLVQKNNELDQPLWDNIRSLPFIDP